MKIYLKLTQNNENGFSAIIMVVILMIIGLLLLTGFNQLLMSWHKTIVMETRYYQRFNQASSALNWALTQDWQTPTEQWQCLTDTKYKLKACVKKSLLKVDNYQLLRGEADGLFLYSLTHLKGTKLVVEKGHWLDYCPEKRSSDCE